MQHLVNEAIVDGYSVKVGSIHFDNHKTASYAQLMVETLHTPGILSKSQNSIKDIQHMGQDPDVDVNCSISIDFKGRPTFLPLPFIALACGTEEICALQYKNPRINFGAKIKMGLNRMGLIQLLAERTPYNMRDNTSLDLSVFRFVYGLPESEAFTLSENKGIISPCAILPEKEPFAGSVQTFFESRMAGIASLNKENILLDLQNIAQEISKKDIPLSKDRKKLPDAIKKTANQYLSLSKEAGGECIDVDRLTQKVAEISLFEKACVELVQSKRILRAAVQDITKVEQEPIRYNHLNDDSGIGQKRVYDTWMKSMRETPVFRNGLKLG